MSNFKYEYLKYLKDDELLGQKNINNKAIQYLTNFEYYKRLDKELQLLEIVTPPGTFPEIFEYIWKKYYSDIEIPKDFNSIYERLKIHFRNTIFTNGYPNKREIGEYILSANNYNDKYDDTVNKTFYDITDRQFEFITHFLKFLEINKVSIWDWKRNFTGKSLIHLIGCKFENDYLEIEITHGNLSSNFYLIISELGRYYYIPFITLRKTDISEVNLINLLKAMKPRTQLFLITDNNDKLIKLDNVRKTSGALDTEEKNFSIPHEIEELNEIESIDRKMLSREDAQTLFRLIYKKCSSIRNRYYEKLAEWLNSSYFYLGENFFNENPNPGKKINILEIYSYFYLLSIFKFKKITFNFGVTRNSFKFFPVDALADCEELIFEENEPIHLYKLNYANHPLKLKNISINYCEMIQSLTDLELPTSITITITAEKVLNYNFDVRYLVKLASKVKMIYIKRNLEKVISKYSNVLDTITNIKII